ncbi:MAG: ATP-binding cassette domain-containing protein [Syntrophaceae bacterium]|nr:ATP-binding cassette domain-containing protein [Syntrophaceae bacterium]
MKERTPIIVVDELTAGYGESIVFEKVSFQVFQGEVFVILGGSGCGKSTLLKQMIGLQPPFSGRVLIHGVDITQADDETLKKVRMGVGVLFQSSALFGSMTLFDNVALPLMEYTNLSINTIEQIVKMKLALVDLLGFENHFPSELSGGMKKRAGIARAMALDPAILFFDEPAAGLDPVTLAGLDLLIKRINEGMGTTMVVVTHELQSIFNIAHRVIMIDKNARGIIAEGDPKELKGHSGDPRVIRFFNRLPG